MNFLSKLHKNSILTGPVDSYCLACGCLLRSEEESYAHIRDSKHTTKLDTIIRLENFKDDCIFKIKEGYYCPYCNIIFPTIKRIRLHVTDPKHQDTKNAQLITKQFGLIFAYNEVIIEEKSWHGLDGSTCFVCNEDYCDEDEHKNKATHILKLIQSKCEFGASFIYRKVDEDTFFCLICGSIHYNDEKSNHHNSEQHLVYYEASKKFGICFREKEIFCIGEPNNNIIKITTKREVEIKEATSDNKPQLSECKTQTDKELINEPENKTTPSETAKGGLENFYISQDFRDINPSSGNNTVNLVRLDSKSNINTSLRKTENIQVKKLVNTPTSNSNDNSQDKKLDINLKAIQFIIKIHDGSKFNHYCTLCDILVDNNSINEHGSNKHHHELHGKYVAYNAVFGNSNRKLIADCIKTKTESDQTITKEKTNEKINIAPGNDQRRKATAVNDESGIKNECKTKECKAPINEQANEKVTASNIKPSAENNESTTKDSKAGIEIKKGKPVVNLETIKEETTVCNEIKEPEEVTHKIETVAKEKPTESTQKDKSSVLENDDATTSVTDTQIGNTLLLHVSVRCKNGTNNTIEDKKASKKIKRAARATLVIPKKYLPKELKPDDKLIKEYSEDNGTTEKMESSSIIVKPATNTEDINLANDIINDTNNNKPNVEKMAANDSGHTTIKTEKFSSILKTVTQFDHAPDDVVINGKYALGNLSLMLIETKESHIQCVACNCVLTQDQIVKHIIEDRHHSNMEESLVFTSLEDEFIRQVNCDVYHCGYCNMSEASWSDMQAHTQSYQHTDSKRCSVWRLERYHQRLRHAQRKEVRSVLSTILPGALYYHY